MHITLLMQSATAAQLVLHAVAEAHLSLPGQGALDEEQVPFWHVPVVSVFPEQLLPQEVPSATLLHVPSLPDTLHFWQLLVQALSQQTPSTQWPLTHSPAPPQVPPFDFLAVHFFVPASQNAWAASQSATEAQALKHLSPEGSHL
jgi:hypothetical protein